MISLTKSLARLHACPSSYSHPRLTFLFQDLLQVPPSSPEADVASDEFHIDANADLFAAIPAASPRSPAVSSPSPQRPGLRRPISLIRRTTTACSLLVQSGRATVARFGSAQKVAKADKVDPSQRSSEDEEESLKEVNRRILLMCKRSYWKQMEAGTIQRDAAK